MNHHRRQPPKIQEPWVGCPSDDCLTAVDLAVIGRIDDWRLFGSLTTRQIDEYNKYARWADITDLCRLKPTHVDDNGMSILKFKCDSLEICPGRYGPFIKDTATNARDSKGGKPICLDLDDCKELINSESVQAGQSSDDQEVRRRMAERMLELLRFANSYAEWYSDEQRQLANMDRSGKETSEGPSVTDYSETEIENMVRLIEFPCECNFDHLLRAECLRLRRCFDECSRELSHLVVKSEEESRWKDCIQNQCVQRNRFVSRVD
jgi:hypothetical protein